MTMTFKNTRPTIIQLPDGKNVLPGETFEMDEALLFNPGVKVLMEAGFICMVDVFSTPPSFALVDAPAPAEPPAPAGPTKLERIATATPEELLEFHTGETDETVLLAIVARADELTK